MHPVLLEIPAALVAVFFGALTLAIAAAVLVGARVDRQAADAARGGGPRKRSRAPLAAWAAPPRRSAGVVSAAATPRSVQFIAAADDPGGSRGARSPAAEVAGARRRPDEAIAAVIGAAIGGAAGFLLVGRHLTGVFPVYSYGVMLASALGCGWLVVMRIGTTRERLPREQLASAFLVTAAFAIVGARALFVLTNLDTLPGPVSWLSFREGGMVAYGGFLGGLFGGWLVWRKRGFGLLGWGDLAAPALGLGLGLTRIGCYLYGCDFGRPLGPDAPGWLKAIGTFPGPRGHRLPSPAFLDQLARHQLTPAATTSLPVHPTQLYESLVGFALFFVALGIWRHRRFRGQALLAITVLYGVARFLLEIVRDDSQRGIYFGLSTSQWISLALVPLALGLYLRLRRQGGWVAPPALAAHAPAGPVRR